MRDVHPVRPDLHNRIVPDQEELPGPVRGPAPELPGGSPGQGHAVEARDLALVLVQDLHRVRERGLRTLHLHEHGPELFDDDEVERVVSPPRDPLHVSAPAGNLHGFIECIERAPAPGHEEPPAAGRSSSRSSIRYVRSLILEKISSFIRSCRSIKEQTRSRTAASNFTYGISGSLP